MFAFSLLAYGRFLSVSIASIAPIMIITMIIAMIPYSTVLFEAKPLAGVAVGAAVAAGAPAETCVSADDGQ